MNFREAQSEFRHCLKNNKTISIPKLKLLMQAMNMSVNHKPNKEVEYLRSENVKLRRRVKRQQKAIRRMNDE